MGLRSFQVRNLHKPRIKQPLIQGDDSIDNAPWVVGNFDGHQINIFNVSAPFVPLLTLQ